MIGLAKRDFYEVLGVDKSADARKIKSAFRRKAKQYHPDTNPGDKEAEKKFKEVNEAYAVLSDPEKKKLYDQFGMAAFEEGAAGGSYQGGFGGGRTYGGGNGGYQEFHFNGDMGDIFSQFFGGGFGGSQGFGSSQRQTGGFSGSQSRTGGFGSYGSYEGFSGMGGGTNDSGCGSGGKGCCHDGENDGNTHMNINITLEDALRGADKVVRIRRQDGTTESLKVHIPAGIDEGKSIRLKGKGKTQNGLAGDLLLKVHILEKDGFDRKGKDLYVNVSVPFTTAVFGGEITARTLEGPVIVRVPAGTQAGSRLCLKGKGLPSVKNQNERGNVYAVVQVEVPKDLTEDEKAQLMQYAQLRRMNGHV